MSRWSVLRRAIVPSLVFAGLSGVYLAETTSFRRAKSVTFDETVYLSCSLQSVHDRRLDRRFVLSGIAPLPMLLTYIPALWPSGGEARQSEWQGQPQDAERIAGPRLLNSLVIGLPLLLLVFVWLMRRGGLWPAAFGTALLAFSPTLVAHGGLATTDLSAALFGMLGIAAGAWYLESPRLGRLVAWGTAIGAAIAAKYSGIFLLPVACAVLAIAAGSQVRSPGWRRWLGAAGRCAASSLLLFLIAGVSCWGLHGFMTYGALKAVPLDETAEYSPWLRLLGRGPVGDALMTFAHEWVPRPAPVEGIFFQLRHNAAGHPAYLMGQTSQFGWWYYFPCAYFFKSTPSELAVTVLVLGGLLLACLRWRSTRPRLDAGLAVLSLSALVVTALLVTAKINIGHRYLILLYPLLALAGGDAVARWSDGRRSLVTWVAVLLLVGQAASSALIQPHDLAYFNGLVGGPQQGRRLLVDSSLDWGQDLPALRDVQRAHPGRLAFKYFGTALPEAYGVRALNLDELPAGIDRAEYLAVSATFLQGAYIDGDPFREFRAQTPIASAGYSILVFDLQPPAARAAYDRLLARLKAASRKDVLILWRSAREQ
uniref:Phospholipid carrier-dependent glycosyltransferase n=1 Tax=Schlesneria paludicola TaxID=360056 RepID=A0A7C2K0P0_9PLAN